RLSDLAADDFALVPNALGLVRVGLAQLADLRRDLTDLLLVDALDAELGRAFDLEGDPLGRLHHDGVAVAEGELQVGALGLDAVPDAADLKSLDVPLGHAGDHVRHQRAGETVQGTDLVLVVGTGHQDAAVV